MYLEKKHKLRVEIEKILKTAYAQKIINIKRKESINEFIDYATFKVEYSSVEIVDTSLISSTYTEILEIFLKIKNNESLNLKELEGWAIYDPRIFLYTINREHSEGQGEGNELKNIYDWFDAENIFYVNKTGKKTVNKCTIIYYNEEIRTALKSHKTFFHISTTIKGGTKYYIDMEDFNLFEKIITITNPKGTKMGYGIW